MTETLGARRLRELFATHGARPDKALGQNFVIDPNTIRKIVDVAGLEGADHVCEIGAGAGSLTVGLAPRCRRVSAIEFDRRLLPILAEVVAEWDNVEVIEADALRFDFNALGPVRVVGNLPYNIAATLVLRLLEEAPLIPDITVMTQREVGERLAGLPGSKAYGAVSVLVHYWAGCNVVATVSRNVFWPVPDVDSVVVRLVRRQPPPVPAELFYRVVKASFAQRRKTLRNNLGLLVGGTSEAERLLQGCGIDPAARAETLPPAEFATIAGALM